MDSPASFSLSLSLSFSLSLSLSLSLSVCLSVCLSLFLAAPFIRADIVSAQRGAATVGSAYRAHAIVSASNNTPLPRCVSAGELRLRGEYSYSTAGRNVCPLPLILLSSLVRISCVSRAYLGRKFSDRVPSRVVLDEKRTRSGSCRGRAG